MLGKVTLVFGLPCFGGNFVLEHVDSVVTRVFRRYFPTRLVDVDFTAFRSSRPGVGRRPFPDTVLSVTFPSIGPQAPDKPESARLAQLRTHRQAATRPPEAPSRRPPEALSQRQVSPSLYERGTNVAEDQRIDDAIARIFGRNR